MELIEDSNLDDETIDLISEILAAAERDRIAFHKPYWWQKDFHNAGKDHAERLLMAANGVGKTLSGAAEISIHATGDYPDWWEGKRFDKPPVIWVGSITNQGQKDGTQPALLGADLGENLGTGFIPLHSLKGKPKTRQAGIPDVVDSFSVKHKSGGVSIVQMKTYEQGWRLWQAGKPDIVWLDEQPDESASNEKMIWSEVQTRVFRSGGIVLVTLTPLLGETDMIRHFMEPKHRGIFWIGATWDDAPHLNREDIDRLLATYPDHEVEVRSKGVPMMGEGRVFTTPEGEITVEPFDIPDYFARIKGIDFGMDHPCAVADIAWDRDSDVVYVTRVWRKKVEEASEHAEAINETGTWIPVAWPHDGENRQKGVGAKLKDHYIKYGVRLLSKSARYKAETGGSQPVEPIVMEIQERAKNGGFKVFSTCREFFEEYRNYHRKDGKIVDRRDDVLKAAFYGVMMKRYAIPRGFRAPRNTSSSPILSMR